MAEAMVVCDGVRHLGLAMGLGFVAMALFQIGWGVRWSLLKSDGVCDGVSMQEEGIFDGVGLDMG
ncbi:unnamed protein product [Prunus armeniaca]